MRPDCRLPGVSDNGIVGIFVCEADCRHQMANPSPKEADFETGYNLGSQRMEVVPDGAGADGRRKRRRGS